MGKSWCTRLLLMVVFAFLYSCSSDDKTSNNIIKFDSNEFKLYMGYQYKYSDAIPETGSTPFVVFMLGDGVTYNQETSSLSGTGALVVFYMYSESNVEIKPGEYTIDIFSTKPTFSADSCEIYYNYNFDQDTGAFYPIKAGTFDVANLGKLMSYDMNLISTGNVQFKGVYEGLIQTLN